MKRISRVSLKFVFELLEIIDPWKYQFFGNRDFNAIGVFLWCNSSASIVSLTRLFLIMTREFVPSSYEVIFL